MTDLGLFPASDLTEDLLGPRGGDDDMLRTAWLSDDGVYRWTLNRVWGSASNLLAWIMCNPSKANHLDDDPTVLRCCGFARRLGFGGIRIVNLSPFIATKPEVCAVAGWPTGGHRGQAQLRQVLEDAHRHDLPVIAAWGNNPPAERVEWLLQQPHADRLTCLGVTKSGAPIHPLARGRSRVPDDAQLIPWPVAS